LIGWSAQRKLLLTTETLSRASKQEVCSSPGMDCSAIELLWQQQQCHNQKEIRTNGMKATLWLFGRLPFYPRKIGLARFSRIPQYLSAMAEAEEQPSFRSVLPHEPLPTDPLGFIHVQGGLEPKKNKQPNQDDPEEICHFYWVNKSDLEEALHKAISAKLPHGAALRSVTVLEDNSSPPYTKFRLCYNSPLTALQVVQFFRLEKVSCHSLLQDEDDGNDANAFQFTSKPLQATLLTTLPFLSTDIAWNRTNPPKFRRLIGRPGEPVELLQQERQSTRFVFLSGLVDTTTLVSSNKSEGNLDASWWGKARLCSEAIRSQINAYDTSGHGVEIYVSNKKKQPTTSCHIGMRSPQDARALIAGLQAKTLEFQLAWNITSAGNEQEQSPMPVIRSDKLFLDYAAVTKRSEAKATAVVTGQDSGKGEKSRPECTSTTAHVVVPGLLLLPNFVNTQEEEVMLAALTGPTAPWAPSQTNFSKSGAVKRKVQHYGYVFDYETANVKRDRTEAGSDCPPMPGLPEEIEGVASDELLDKYVETSALEGQGWDALAGIVERIRRKEFDVSVTVNEEPQSTPIKQFPNINQTTVNIYEPGEGIGSHVDTPSAFDDGLISLSLNGGVVMEFRKHNSPDKVKKLVYLPPRSLLLMSGPARYEWEHMIVTRMTDTVDGIVLPRSLRVSLTLRTAIDLSGNPMPNVVSRQFPPVWGKHTVSDDARVTPSMEREHVHAVYDAIATQWHHTRGKRGVLWPGATQFLQELPEGSIVADVGCGDGKYFPAIWEAGSYVIGSDISLPLLQQAAYQGDVEAESRRVSERRHHLRRMPAVAVADCMNIPLRSKSCDAAICIAVMHHLSTRERRIRCISELSRIVKVGGLINIQAWAMEQQENSRRKFAGTDVFVPFNAQPKYLDKVEPKAAENAPGEPASKSTAQVYSEEYKNVEYDEQKGLVVFKRYCHMYRKGELEELVDAVDAVKLHEGGYESGNHFVILRVVK
jgi:alkylated DNA repair dioxygenase AlkB/ubiquinone/menaquinone biosynthesis C-methylase UbiE